MLLLPKLSLSKLSIEALHPPLARALSTQPQPQNTQQLRQVNGWVSIFDHDEVWRRRGPEWWESGVERGVIGATDQPSRHTAEIDDQGKDQNLKISQIQRRSRFTQNKVMPRPSQISRIRFPNRAKVLGDGFQKIVLHMQNSSCNLVNVEI